MSIKAYNYMREAIHELEPETLGRFARWNYRVLLNRDSALRSMLVENFFTYNPCSKYIVEALLTDVFWHLDWAKLGDLLDICVQDCIDDGTIIAPEVVGPTPIAAVYNTICMSIDLAVRHDVEKHGLKTGSKVAVVTSLGEPHPTLVPGSMEIVGFSPNELYIYFMAKHGPGCDSVILTACSMAQGHWRYMSGTQNYQLTKIEENSNDTATP